MGVIESTCEGKYLGLLYLMWQAKKEIFSYIRERVLKKTKGWKEKLLSQAGKEVLVKAILQAIPIYVMSVFLLPKNLCEEISSIIK